MLIINGEYPAGRLFGAVMEVDDDLYITSINKERINMAIDISKSNIINEGINII